MAESKKPDEAACRAAPEGSVMLCVIDNQITFVIARDGAAMARGAVEREQVYELVLALGAAVGFVEENEDEDEDPAEAQS